MLIRQINYATIVYIDVHLQTTIPAFVHSYCNLFYAAVVVESFVIALLYCGCVTVNQC